VLQLAEQEEEDVNRIKEESRRRRQAILEKYKAKQSQQQRQTSLDDTVNENMKQTSQPEAAENIDKEETVKNRHVDATVFSVEKSPTQNGKPEVEMTTGVRGLGEGTPKSEMSDDMFRDDIFGESPAGVRKPGRGDGLAIERSGLHDNWDDAEGYYSYRFGELLDARYEVIAAHGKGVFSTVVRARDLKAGSNGPEEVAIKIIRNNETMYKAGIDESAILKKLVGADPEDKRHCVRFLSSFKYRNHLCLVFESLHMNLREVLKKFGRNIGLKLTAVRAYAKQLFIALKHLRNCGVLHCDIKPDNMLVNDAKNVLKLCDFGNAMFAGKNEITPYLVSRFYRAPEIILGLPYDHPMDIWSVGCCLFELYSGKVLFPGPSNNDMLRLHMELKGPFPKKMLRKGAFVEQHFDQDLNFLATEEDPVTKKIIKRLVLNIKPKDMGSIILSSPGEDPKMLINFKDLMEKIFVLDPDRRITVSQALSHPFITGK
jgi:serine/threonine-protein kinase PRP4